MRQGKGLNPGTKLLKGTNLLGGTTLKEGSSLLSSGSINSKSKRQKGVDKELSKVYSKMDSRDDICCSGCGCTDGLQHSHIIPRSRREDLITVPENITHHCMMNCHPTWEHGTIKEKMKMEDFTQNMSYIKRVDREYYELLISREK